MKQISSAILRSLTFHDIKKTGTLTQEYYTMTFDRNGWRRVDSDRGIVGQGTYNFGCVPAVILMCKNLNGLPLTPPSEMLSLAKVNRTIYNLCSWLNEILKNITFPILTLPSLDTRDVIVGNNNALGYNPEFSHEPNFIAPPSDPANILKEQILNMVQEMYRMAGLSFVTELRPTRAAYLSNGTLSDLISSWRILPDRFKKPRRTLSNCLLSG